jgi:hypothetical protein
MRLSLSISLMSFAAAAALAFAAMAAPADDFNAAYAKAEAASKEAVALKTLWTTTVETLKAAKDAAGAGKLDDAIALAKKAEALAEASVAQAREEQRAWKDAVIR